MQDAGSEKARFASTRQVANAKTNDMYSYVTDISYVEGRGRGRAESISIGASRDSEPSAESTQRARCIRVHSFDGARAESGG